MTSSIHATAVAIDGEALVIIGPSRAGKSRLAAALISRAAVARPIVLVGDDRILISNRSGSCYARPHPRIAGFMERRGLGIVAMDWVGEAPIGGVADLRPGGDAPRFGLVEGLRQCSYLVVRPDTDPNKILAWWDTRGAAVASHQAQKSVLRDRTRAKD